jgi:ElaB/YqjD/DUF883 family membrane-anchored ribosome-binding protein
MKLAKSQIRSFGDKAEEIRKRAADSLESAADSVREAGSQGADTIHDFADQAGKKLDSTASYVRKTCVEAKLFGSLRGSVRRNPLQSLALAGAVGLVAGFCLRPGRDE